ncbi:hypothetical protein HYDPIDRAFT_44839 [Hydnomerulius pinastri MD-312]|uniref:Thioredoxin n=1 Tax=Hydnomerulius pinastri MD-312 TaxID=994086 RepID=A0A0C9VJR3_9AGAM|nr:hypothetical protein HYDPIDRAFT_44839 [Hydnomerulius pinastri MD-312]
MTVSYITSKDQYDQIINSGKVVYIDFTAQWCGPCKMISPIFEKHASEDKSGAEFYKVDIDDQPKIAEAAEIGAMPTFKTYKDGNVVNTLVGAKPADLRALIVAGLALQ